MADVDFSRPPPAPPTSHRVRRLHEGQQRHHGRVQTQLSKDLPFILLKWQANGVKNAGARVDAVSRLCCMSMVADQMGCY